MKNHANNILTDDNQQIIREIITASTYKPKQSCILFGVTKDDRIREETERQVGEGLREIRSLQYMDLRHYRENYTDFLPALREVSEAQPSFIFVRGLDDLIAGDIHKGRMVGSRPLILNYLNINREFFLAYPAHVLFWISPETERMLFDYAPDLWAFRTHSHFFDEIVREEPPDLSCLNIIELIPYEGKKSDLERDISIKEELLSKFLSGDKEKPSYQEKGLLKELAVRYYLKRDYGKAQEYAEKAAGGELERGREGDGKNDPELLDILALCYGRNIEYGKAVELLEKACRIAEDEYIYRDWKAVLLNNLGILFYWKEDWEKAGEFFGKALDNTPAPEKSEDGKGREGGEAGSYNESRNKYNRIFILSNQGTVLFREMKLKEAGDKYNEAFKTFSMVEPKLFGNLTHTSWKYDTKIEITSIIVDLANCKYLDTSSHDMTGLSEPSHLPLSETAALLLNCGVLLYIEGISDSSSMMLNRAMKFNYLDNDKESIERTLNWILSKRNWKSLNFSDIGLDSLPPEIGNLNELELLDLRINYLSNLPQEFGNLSNLKELFLNINELTEFPAVITKLKKLCRLSITHNSISSLPSEIGSLCSLEDLNLRNNHLSQLPYEFGNLENLKELFLNFNEFTEFPDEITKLKKLCRLIISHNSISSLPPEIGSLSSLEELDLRYNKHLNSIPPEIGNLKNLKILELDDNDISTIPSKIGNLSNLKTMTLYKNKISTIPPEIRKLKNLRTLRLQGNPLPIPDEILSKTDSPSDILDYYFNK